MTQALREICFAWTGACGQILATYEIAKQTRYNTIDNNRTVDCKVVRFVHCRVVEAGQIYENIDEVVPSSAKAELSKLLLQTVTVPFDVFERGAAVYVQRPE